jgi:hypothetical protein
VPGELTEGVIVNALFDVGVPVLAVLVFLAAIVYLLRALNRRGKQEGPMVYGVGRQELRHAIQVDLARSLILLIAGLITLGVYGLRPMPAEMAPGAVVTQPASVPQETAPLVEAVTASPAPITTPTLPASPTVTATATSPVSTATPTSIPTETATPEPPTAVVDSPNGLWLRESAGTGGAVLENLAHNSVLLLLPGQETVDEIDWQQVRAPSGNEGWVAAQFLIYPD